jgi:hypothetical protein
MAEKKSRKGWQRVYKIMYSSTHKWTVTWQSPHTGNWLQSCKFFPTRQYAREYAKACIVWLDQDGRTRSIRIFRWDTLTVEQKERYLA